MRNSPSSTPMMSISTTPGIRVRLSSKSPTTNCSATALASSSRRTPLARRTLTRRRSLTRSPASLCELSIRRTPWKGVAYKDVLELRGTRLVRLQTLSWVRYLLRWKNAVQRLLPSTVSCLYTYCCRGTHRLLPVASEPRILEIFKVSYSSCLG